MGLLAAWLALQVLAPPRPQVVLVYVRGAGAERCPDGAGLQTLVAGRLGYDPFDLIPDAGSDRQIAVSVTFKDGLLAADVKVEGSDGSFLGNRHFAAAALDCVGLTEAVTLMLAVVIDPLSLSAPGTAAELQTAARKPVVAGTPIAVPASARAPAWRLTLAVLGAGGAAPDVNLGTRAGLEYHREAWSLEAALRSDLPSDSFAAASSFGVWLVGVEGVPCARAGAWRFCLPLLVGEEFSSYRPHGPTQAAADPLAAAGARVAFEQPLAAHLWWRLSLEALLPFARRRYLAQEPPGGGTGELWVTPVSQGDLSLDLLWEP